MNQKDTTFTLTDGADGAVDYVGLPYQLNGVQDFSIHVKFSSNTLGGTLILQASNDPTAFTSPATADWVDVSGSSQTVTSGASHVWNVQNANYKFTRYLWTAGAGTGTIKAWLEVKYTGG